MLIPHIHQLIQINLVEIDQVNLHILLYSNNIRFTLKLRSFVSASEMTSLGLN